MWKLGLSTTVIIQLTSYYKNGIRKLTIGAKYLIYEQKYKDKSKEIRSWVERNRFDFKRLIPTVRFLAYHRIKPHAPPLVRAPVNSFEFHSCERTPQVGYLSLSLSHSDTRSKQLVTIVYGVDYQGI